MSYTPQRGDQIRWKVGGVELTRHTTLNTIPGVTIDQVSVNVVSGQILLRQTVSGGVTRLQMASPADLAAGIIGAPVPITTSGTYLIASQQIEAWCRVIVDTDYLLAGTQETIVYLQPRYHALGLDDVTAAEAVAGDVTTFTVTATNEGPGEVYLLTVSIEDADYIELSDDGVSWTTDAVELASILAPAASVTLHLRRTIPAMEPADPAVLTHLNYTFLNQI